MGCQKYNTYLDYFFNGSLSAGERVKVMEHLSRCDTCRAIFERHGKLLAELSNLPTPSPTPGFNDRVIRTAVAVGRRKQFFNSGIALAAAMAASLVVWTITGMPGINTPTAIDTSPSEITVALNQPRNVEVVVDAPRALANATITIQLSSNLELAGFPSSEKISWQTDLRKGKNLLILPVVAKKIGNERLVATIRHHAKSKKLELEMVVRKKLISNMFGCDRYNV